MLRYLSFHLLCLVQGKYNRDIMKDLFGEGIFAVDGKKWRHQRKLASYEFSARVLREFSCSVFRSNAAKLASKVYEEALASREMDLQVSFNIISLILATIY